MEMNPNNLPPGPDQVLIDIANYVVDTTIRSEEAYATSRLCLMDALGCAMAALAHPACIKLLGPIVLGAVVPNGARIPGTQFQLDPWEREGTFVQNVLNFDKDREQIGSMPRSTRIGAPGVLHHVMGRGIEKRVVFEAQTWSMNTM